MQCSCGGAIREKSHAVKTEKAAKEWGCDGAKLPLSVASFDCVCTRHAHVVTDAEGKEVARHGI